MELKRVCVVITARPSYSRIKSALVALRSRPDVELLIVAAASALVTRYGRIVDQVEADGFKVAEEISSVVDGDTLADSSLSTGLLLTQISGAFRRLQPDVVVTIADRHETLATAIAASYQHIPLCHIQGGEVTGSIDDKVRNAVTQLADVHCVSTGRAASNVECMAGASDQIYVTGCPSIDLAAQALRLGEMRDHWGKVNIIVLQHSVTDQHDQAAEQIEQTIEAVESLGEAGALGEDGTWLAQYFWPGEDAGGRAMAKVMRAASVGAVANMEPMHFLRLLAFKATVLVGNSSVGIRECSFLGVPVVNIGTRQQGRERGPNVIDASHDAKEIAEAIRAQIAHGRYEQSTLYGDGRAGYRIADVLSGVPVEAVA